MTTTIRDGFTDAPAHAQDHRRRSPRPACDLVMGHERSHMSTVYRERISDERLKAVTDYVHWWLFAAAKAGSP